MKIIIAIPCLNRGGTEMQTLSLVRVLVGEGHQITILCYFEFNQEMVCEYQQAGCMVELMKLQSSIRPWTLINLLLKRYIALKPDVVHVQYMAPGALPILAAKLAGVPHIYATVHQPYTESHGLISKIILRFAARLCERFVVVSKNAEESWFGSSQLLRLDLPINKQPRHLTIYNTIEVETIQKIASRFSGKPDLEKLGIPDKNICIGAVSRIRVEKGIDILLEAFSELVKHGQKNITLLLVGDGPDKNQLMERAITLGCSDNVVFFGAANWEKAMSLLPQMDIVVVPSRFEGFGLSAAEAMAMAKPLIVSEVFGLKELVEDRVNGLLFQVGDIKALTIAIRTLIVDSQFAQNLGQEGLNTVLQKFDYPIFQKNIAKLYNLN